MIRCLELFAGAGGAALDLERAGLHHAALCEWDRDACATLRAAGLGPVVEGDVRDLDAIAAAVGPAPVDVLWSSFPCQAFSTAGKRLGAADERNGWPWTVDAIDRFRPTWLIGENVRGLLLHRAGCTYRGGQEGLFSAPDPQSCPGCYFERVILPDLRARFACVGWWLLDAADFGVPQHRRRVILWAGAAPLTEPTPTHGPGRALPWVSMGEALGLDGAAYTGRWEDGRGEVRADGPAPTVTTEWGHAQPWTKAGAGWMVQSGVCDSACETHGVARECTRPSPTVPVTSHLYLAAPSPTVSAVGEQKGSGPGGHPERMQRASDALYLGTGRRRLTVAECALLQDFPAEHPWQGGVGARYRQVGNAVPPRLAEVVGRALIEATK
jgi:DNA (cytosine-5)-methyltransferase 1